MIAARLEPVPSPEPFADDTAGFGYFATDFHYEHLVARLRHHLASTRGFFLVSGAPAPDGELVERAINARKDAPHRATLVRCRSGMTLGQVTRAYARQLGLTDESDGTGQWSLLSRLMEDSRKGVIRVLVLENADALDDRGFDELHRFATLDDPHFLPVVLLAQRSFAARLDAPSLQFLQPAIVAHLSLHHLETEEVAAFIRYQLNATDGRHEAVFTRDAIAALADAAKGDPAVVNRLARQAAGLPARKPASASPQPAAAAPPPLAMAAPKPSQPKTEQPKAEQPKADRPKAEQPKAERPKLEPRIVMKPVEPMGPPAPKQAAGPAAAPSAPKRSATAPVKARAAAAKRNSRKSSAPVASLMVAMLMRARSMAPAATIAAYVVLAAASAGALFYVLAPTADREEAEAPQVQTVISSDLPTPAPRVVKPVAPAPLPAIPPAPEVAIAVPPVAPREPVISAAPPPPSTVQQQAPEPPPAAAGAPIPPPQALAMIEPTAGAKPSGDVVAKVEPAPAPVPPSPAAKPPGEIAAKTELAPWLAPQSAPAKAPSEVVAKAEPAPPPAKLPSGSVAKTEPAPAPVAPLATATPPSESVAKIEAEPAPLPPRAADKPPSGATAALVHRGEALLVSGDIVSARQFFARAAETGDAAAACGLGKSYDPLFLQRVGTRGVAGDAAKAVDWYRRAARAGSNEAAARLARLLVKFPQ